jgi:hypothetical protein
LARIFVLLDDALMLQRACAEVDQQGKAAASRGNAE